MGVFITMSPVAEYNPVHAVKVPGVEAGVVEAETKGLFVIVGPNSSGKTLFLRDVENALLATGQQPVVCQAMFLQRPTDCNSFIQDLLAQRQLLTTEPGQVMI